MAATARDLLGDIDFDPAELHAKYLHERDKRIRPDGNEQYVEITDRFASFGDDPWADASFEREPLTDHVDVVIVGGGFGGLLAAAHLREIGVKRIRLIDAAGDVGGTWYWNRYPGAACDVQSYIYLPLLEELGAMPQHKYSFAPEIMEHSRRIARHFDLYDDACFQTGVTSMEWDDGESRWTVFTDRNDEMTANIVVLATGPLNRPKLPGIAGITSFEGHMFHTSRWDYDYTGGDTYGGLVGLSDKRVAIIGTGATAVQCVPHLADSAKELFVFQRTPSSVDVRDNAPTDTDWFESLEPGWQKRYMENFTALVSGYDEPEDLVGDGWTEIFRGLTGIAAKDAARRLGRRLDPREKDEMMELLDYRKMNGVRNRVQTTVVDPSTAAALQPWYRQFCKRPCFHDSYLPAFNSSNVTLVDTDGQGVERITSNGVVVNGVEHEVDCIVFSTGFEYGTSYTRRAGFDVTGRNGETLSEHWADGVRTFHGMHAHGFPNMAFIGFVQTATTVNIPHALAEQSAHFAHVVAESRARGASVIEATPQSEQEWLTEIERTAVRARKFYEECTPGYYNNEGHVTDGTGFAAGMYGAGPIKFFDLLARWRDEGGLSGLQLR
ncbi:MAG: NAD(P)/FAD-dependent oxidoreductase [Actinomycetota bacterium]|nr:NAD(P)/FAD-dependent oxidoreductase [Actinomycetota bacterium]